MSNKKIIKCVKNRINISTYFHDIGYSDISFNGYNSYSESDYLNKRFNEIIDGYYDYTEEDSDSSLYNYDNNSNYEDSEYSDELYEDSEYSDELYEDKTIYYYVNDPNGNIGEARLIFHNLHEFDSFLSDYGYDVSSDDVYSYIEYDVMHCCLDPLKNCYGVHELVSDISYDSLESKIKDKINSELD